MKSIYASYENKEFERLKLMKEKTGKSWEDYIVLCAEYYDRCVDDGR